MSEGARWVVVRKGWLAKVVVLVTVLGMLLTASRGEAALTPVATESGTCSSGSYEDYTYPTLGAAIPYPIESFRTSGGAGEWTPVEEYDGDDSDDDGPSFGSGDTVWAAEPSNGALAAGETETGSVECPGDSLSFTAQLFEAPSTPSSFSGTTTPGDFSEIEFVLPGTADYNAVVSVQSGAVQIQQASNLQPSGMQGEGYGNPVASTATIPLGQQSSGPIQLDVVAQDGPQATWTVAVQAVPVALTGPAFPVSAAQPGANLPLSYSVTADGTLNAAITGPTGSVLRQLATNLPVSEGQHSLTWDGFDANGNPPPDGTYTANFTFTDDAGNVVSGSAKVVLDSTPPTVRMTSPRELKFNHALDFNVEDAGSGVKSSSATIDGRSVGQVKGGGNSSVRPGYAWAPGIRYAWSVKAVDNVGNNGITTGTFSGAPMDVQQFARLTLSEKNDVAIAYLMATVNNVCLHGLTPLAYARDSAATDLPGIRPGRDPTTGYHVPKTLAVGKRIRQLEGEEATVQCFRAH